MSGRPRRTPRRLIGVTLPPFSAPISPAGTIRFKDRLLFPANALKQHEVRLEEMDGSIWSPNLGALLLGTVDEGEMKVYG